jgi:ankyrin repeat protein
MSNNLTINNSTLEILFINIIKKNKWELFFELINSKVFNINFRDNKGRNALFWAINQKNVPVIKQLINLKINTSISTGLTAMNYAVYKDNVKIIKVLKNCGLNIDEGDEINSTPLIYAVLYNKQNSINYLVNNGANILHEDFFGNSALSLANDLRIESIIEKLNISLS